MRATALPAQKAQCAMAVRGAAKRVLGCRDCTLGAKAVADIADGDAATIRTQRLRRERPAALPDRYESKLPRRRNRIRARGGAIQTSVLILRSFPRRCT